jgi:hypothetical protein
MGLHGKKAVEQNVTLRLLPKYFVVVIGGDRSGIASLKAGIFQASVKSLCNCDTFTNQQSKAADIAIQ